jgi:hypothetical protein
MKKFFLLFMFLFPVFLAAQEVESMEEPELSLKDRIFYGMGGGLQFGSDFTVIALSPQIGYRLTPKWSAGLGVSYQYMNYRSLELDTHTYGGSLFTRYFLLQQVYTQLEYENLSLEMPSLLSEVSRRWVDRLMLGAAYFAPAGRRGGMHIGILYDLFFTPSSAYPYDSPWVYRVGFTF